MTDSEVPVNVGSSNSPFKFQTIVPNVGNAYNSQTGVFTAPVSGNYVFYAQLMKHGTIDSYFHYVIDKEGVVPCKNSLDTPSYDKSSCLATAHVQKGEAVFVRRFDGGSTVEGLSFCAFSGFLLSADAS